MRERSAGHWRDPRFRWTLIQLTGKPRQVRTHIRRQRSALQAKALATARKRGRGRQVHRLDRHRRPAARPLARGYRGRETAAAHRVREPTQDRRPRSVRSSGHIKLAKLDAEALDQAYGDWLSEGLSPATVHKYHSILSAACRQAVKWGWMDSAPTARATPPAPERKEMLVPTPERLTKLLKAADDEDPVTATARGVGGINRGPRRRALRAAVVRRRPEGRKRSESRGP